MVAAIPARPAPRTRVGRGPAVLPAAWSLLLGVLMLWPALAPGYVLSYDMVWVPDLTLGRDALGLGSTLPRAVPSDAVVAVLDESVPGWLLQKAVLLGSLVAAGAGAAAVVPRLSLPARLAAASVIVWNPFVVERLVIGHWPLLVAYGVAPWLFRAAVRYRRTGERAAPLLWLVPLGSLSPSAGILTAVLLLAACLSRTSPRRMLLPLAVVVAANAPWWMAGLLHAADARSSAEAAGVFALSGEGALPAPLAALGLGGIWNAEVVPDSREGVLGWCSLLLVVLAGLGLRRWWRADRSQAARLAAAGGVGYAVALAGWVAPELIGWLSANVPGGGLLRDGHRGLALVAVLLAVLAAYGVEVLLAAVAGVASRAAVLVLAGGLVLLPVAVLPDAAWGAQGRLRAVSYPEEWGTARDTVARVADRSDADVLLLPFSAYRAPQWNGGRTVLDPLGRYLSRDYVTSDALPVSGTVLPGEDPRARRVAQALALPSAARRSAALAAQGIGVVVRLDDEWSRSLPAALRPEVAGEPVGRYGDLVVTELPQARRVVVPTSWQVAMIAAWAAFLGCLAIGVAQQARLAWRSVRGERHHES